MDSLNLGYCGICDTQIFKEAVGRMVPNENYAEFWIAIDDGSIAKHGICSNCYGSLDQDKVLNVFERIRGHWFSELVGAGDDQEFARLAAKTVVSWGISEQDVYTNTIVI